MSFHLVNSLQVAVAGRSVEGSFLPIEPMPLLNVGKLQKEAVPTCRPK